MSGTWAFAFAGDLLLVEKDADAPRVPSVEELSAVLGADALEMAGAALVVVSSYGPQTAE